MRRTNLEILTSPLFVIGLAVLLLNDFVLKQSFGNFLTGKLSDFAGLFVFPLFWAAFYPKRRKEIFVFTAIFFIFWKSRQSQQMIDLWNDLGIFRIVRVVDNTDLVALVVLPISYIYSLCFRNLKIKSILQTRSLTMRKAKILFLCIFSLFAFTATSYEYDRDVSLSKKYEMNLTIDEFERIVKNEKSFKIHSFEKETDLYPANQYPNHESDPTLYYLHFDLDKPFCESPNLRIFVPVNVKESHEIIISRQTISYWCEQPPTEKDKAELEILFESEVIEKIRQNETQ